MAKRLVAYFSATGRTAKLAMKISEATGADIFEIKPETPYSKADQNYMNPLARCNKEKIGKKDIPLTGRVENMDEYDVIYLGFPMWYWGAPNVITTFVKQYDLSNKKLVLFVTSGGSGIGRTEDKLKPYLSAGAQIVRAEVINDDPDVDSLKKWAVW